MNELEKQLQSVKLKKSTVPTRDFSSPKTAGFIQQAEINSYQSSVLDVNTEEWLDLLKDCTFPTEYVSISRNEAELFVKIYERSFANIEPVAASKLSWQEKLTPEESRVITHMSERLQQGIDSFVKEPGDFVFVKMSSRSPKDAPMAQERLRSIYTSYLHQESSENRLSENTQITCLLKACFEALKASTTSEVLDCCLRSERVYQDLLLALAVPERFRENWVVRQFVHIDVDMEFRAFVHSQHLTAISQYNYLIYSQRVAENQNYYLEMIKDFFRKKVHAKLKDFVKDFIIDFAVCDDGAQIWVIEINPFLTTTDAALFSWEHERHLLEGTESKDVILRVTERPRPGAKSMLPNGMKGMIKDCEDDIS